MAIELGTLRARRVFAVVGAFLSLSLTPALASAPAASSSTADLREQDVPPYTPVSPTEPIVGRIEIPRVGVSAVILQGVDDATIRRAVGHFPETPMPDQPGNMALAAHRTTDFHGLRDIRPGDLVSIVSPKGTFQYEVERTWVVLPEDVSVLDPSREKVLTLVTCFPFDYRGSAPERFIVRARSVDPPPPAPPSRLPSPVPLDDPALLLSLTADPHPAG
jgi:sortase A